MDAHSVVAICGAILLTLGIVGGGVTLRELQVPRINTYSRVIAFMVGLLLIGIGTHILPGNFSIRGLQDSVKDPKVRDAEVPQNLALGGRAAQSSTDYGADATRAIDGSRSGDFFRDSSVTHTRDQPGSYWEVSLTRPSTIQRIVLFNRSDCCGSRLSNFRVSVHNETNELYSHDVNRAVADGGKHEVLVPSGTRGNKIRVELKGKNDYGDGVLSLAEVEVYGR